MQPPKPEQDLNRRAPWDRKAQEVSTKFVQHAYVNCRLRDINTSGNHAALLEATKTALRALPRFQKANKVQLECAIAHMTRRLQLADLTINFKATSWFSTENTYDSYTQMYQRAMRSSRFGQMVLTDQPQNPARVRSGVDDKVTFPEAWGMKTAFLGPEEGFRYAIAPPQLPRGQRLSPGFTRNQLMGKMAIGPLQGAVVQRGDEVVEGYLTQNQQFDPKTKQIFAALNYGRRPHGATTRYGYSHLVLHDKFKIDALYYAGDTFNSLLPGWKNTAEHQLSYSLLGFIYEKAKNDMRVDLVRSCLDDATLLSTGKEELLLEGHLFESLEFRGNLKTVYISARDLPANDPNRAALYRTIQANARTFAQKHGAQIVFMD
jgi:hypothetical protein